MPHCHRFEDLFFKKALEITRAVQDRLWPKLWVRPSLKDSLDTVKLFYTYPIADAVQILSDHNSSREA